MVITSTQLLSTLFRAFRSFIKQKNETKHLEGVSVLYDIKNNLLLNIVAFIALIDYINGNKDKRKQIIQN